MENKVLEVKPEQLEEPVRLDYLGYEASRENEASLDRLVPLVSQE